MYARGGGMDEAQGKRQGYIGQHTGQAVTGRVLRTCSLQQQALGTGMVFGATKRPAAVR